MNKAWVVYESHHGARAGMKSVCEEGEWQVLGRTGKHQLIRDRITSEAEAERFARGNSGDAPIAPRTGRGQR